MIRQNYKLVVSVLSNYATALFSHLCLSADNRLIKIIINELKVYWKSDLLSDFSRNVHRYDLGYLNKCVVVFVSFFIHQSYKNSSTHQK